MDAEKEYAFRRAGFILRMSIGVDLLFLFVTGCTWFQDTCRDGALDNINDVNCTQLIIRIVSHFIKIAYIVMCILLLRKQRAHTSYIFQCMIGYMVIVIIFFVLDVCFTYRIFMLSPQLYMLNVVTTLTLMSTPAFSTWNLWKVRRVEKRSDAMYSSGVRINTTLLAPRQLARAKLSGMHNSVQ